MSRKRILAGIIYLGLAATAGVALIGRGPSHASGAIMPAAASGEELQAVRAREIALFERRAKDDPWSAGDQMILAQLFMQRARETGSHEDVLRAEAAARRSLELRTAHNHRAYGVLAMSLVEQHRFQEALEAMTTLVAAEPLNSAFRASLGEIHLEVGDYGRAGVIFESLEPARDKLDVAPRIARWLEVTGRSDEARVLLQRTLHSARQRVDLNSEQIAWFHLRLGDLELRNGRLDEAEAAFAGGLAASPDDYRLLSAMSRLAAARGDWDESIRLGEMVLGQLLDPTTLVLLSEVHAARGDREQAEEYATVLKVAVQAQTGFHRDWSLFLLDRGETTAEILAQAREEVRTRKDVYGQDVLAWALHKNGQDVEAGKVMAGVLEVGVQDALLFYHAGVIEAALGNHELSARYLDRALDINPHFHPKHAEDARAMLSASRGGVSWKGWLNLQLARL